MALDTPYITLIVTPRDIQAHPMSTYTDEEAEALLQRHHEALSAYLEQQLSDWVAKTEMVESDQEEAALGERLVDEATERFSALAVAKTGTGETTMSTVMDTTECRQCGFLGARKESYQSSEWRVQCRRCGYHECWTHNAHFKNGHLRIGINGVVYSAGAYCTSYSDTGDEEYGALSEAEVDKVAAKTRAGIASGELSSRSYVTKFNFETHELTALVGQVPTCDETPGEENSSAAQEDK